MDKRAFQINSDHSAGLCVSLATEPDSVSEAGLLPLVPRRVTSRAQNGWQQGELAQAESLLLSGN